MGSGEGFEVQSRLASQSSGIFIHGADFMNDLLIVDLMESGGSVK